MDSQEVRPESGLPYFIVGLVIAAFFGGAVQMLLSNSQLKSILERRLNQEGSELRVEVFDPELALRDGFFFPRLGLEVAKVEIRSLVPCRFNHSLVAKNLYLPLNVFASLGGSLKLTHPKIKDMTLNLKGKECEKQMKGEGGVVVAPYQAREVATKKEERNTFLSKYWATQFTKDKIALMRLADFISVDRFTIFNRKTTPDYALSNLMLSLDSSLGPKIQGNWHFLEVERVLKGEFPLDINLVVMPNQIHLTGESRIREGEIVLEGLIEPITEDFQLKIGIQDLPMEHATELIARFFPQVQIQSRDQKLAWFTCQAAISGQLYKSNQSLMELKGCQLAGKIGRVGVIVDDFRPFRKPLEFKNIEVLLEKVDVTEILNSVSKTGIPGVLSHHGYISGKLIGTPESELEFVGSWDDVEIAFSRNSVGGRQALKSAKIGIQFKEQRLSGLLNQFQIEEGAIEGALSFNMDTSVSEGVFQIQLASIKFKESVQKLMVSGSLEPISVYGKGVFGMSGLETWEGVIGSEKIVSKEWTFEDFKIDSTYSVDESFKGEVKINKIKLSPEAQLSRFFNREFEKTFKEEGASSHTLSQVSGKLSVHSKGGGWSGFSGRLDGRMGRVKSEGEWKKSTLLEGWLQVSVLGGAEKKYSLGGRLGEPTLE